MDFFGSDDFHDFNFHHGNHINLGRICEFRKYFRTFKVLKEIGSKQHWEFTLNKETI